VASVIYLGNIIYIITKNQRFSSIVIIALGISPTGFGFSRFLVIEPILGALGILILALCLKFNFRCGNRRQTFALLCLLFVSAIYFKPTAIVFLAPICLTLLASLGLIAGLKATLVVGVTSFLLIMPWGVRNFLLGANTLFPAHANIFPANISGISSWVKSWAVTEYDYTRALFPIWSGEIQKVVISKNLFLDGQSASNALELIRVNSNFSLSSETDLAFSKLSASLNSPTPLNFLRILALKILQSISLILHPANSWGLPIEVSSKGNIVNPSTAQFAIYIQNIPKIVAKLLLFVWRLFFYSVLSISLIRLLCTGNFISRLSRTAPNPDNRSIGPLMVLLSLSLLLSTLILFVGIFTTLEHRYLYPVVPWIEAACICFMFRPIMTLKSSS